MRRVVLRPFGYLARAVFLYRLCLFRAGSAPGCQSYDVEAITALAVGGLPERLVEGVGPRVGGLDEDNGRGNCR
jgi:hypothetical protein